MTNIQPKQRYEIGMIGLGFIGRILVLNMVSRGFAVAGNNKVLMESAERRFRDVLECIRLFRKPDSMIMFVPATAPVDSVIKDLSEHFKLDDFSLAEVQLCLTRFNTKNKSQNSRLKLLLDRK